MVHQLPVRACGALVVLHRLRARLHPAHAVLGRVRARVARFGMMSWPIIIISFAAKQESMDGLSDSMFVSVCLQLVYIAKFFLWEGGYMCSIDIMHDKYAAGMWAPATTPVAPASHLTAPPPSPLAACAQRRLLPVLGLHGVGSVPVHHPRVLAGDAPGRAGAAAGGHHPHGRLDVHLCQLRRRPAARVLPQDLRQGPDLGFAAWYAALSSLCALCFWLLRCRAGTATEWLTCVTLAAGAWGVPDKIVASYKTLDGKKKTNLLLVSGYWALARHFHYLPELGAAFCWSVPALFTHSMP